MKDSCQIGQISNVYIFFYIFWLVNECQDGRTGVRETEIGKISQKDNFCTYFHINVFVQPCNSTEKREETLVRADESLKALDCEYLMGAAALTAALHTMSRVTCNSSFSPSVRAQKQAIF
jgi:hypothetical protein